MLTRKSLGSLTGPGPTLISRLPMRNTTMEGVRRGMVRESEQPGSRRSLEDPMVEGVKTEEK